MEQGDGGLVGDDGTGQHMERNIVASEMAAIVLMSSIPSTLYLQAPLSPCM